MEEYVPSKRMHRDEDDANLQERDAAAKRSASKELVVAQTPTGYWVVQRGSVALAGAMTRRAAEAERDMRLRLARRSVRRATTRV